MNSVKLEIEYSSKQSSIHFQVVLKVVKQIVMPKMVKVKFAALQRMMKASQRNQLIKSKKAKSKVKVKLQSRTKSHHWFLLLQIT